MKNLLLRRAGKLYQFLKFDFQDHADGSLYIIFDRKPDDERVFMWSSDGSTPVETTADIERLRISYHTTGRVNFHGHSGDSIFCEPTFAITQEQFLCTISIPSLERLPTKNTASSSDFVADVDAALDGRMSFFLHIAPNNFKIEGSRLEIEYASWFKIMLRIGPLMEPLPVGSEEHFVTLVPQAGPYPSQLLSMGNAIIAFHQKAQGAAADVAYFEPNEGVYRLIFASQMRVAPKAKIEFLEPSIEAEIVAVTPYQLKFKAKGPAGYLKREALPIRGIVLDARM